MAHTFQNSLNKIMYNPKNDLQQIIIEKKARKYAVRWELVVYYLV